MMKNQSIVTKQQIVYETLNAITHGVSFIVSIILSGLLFMRAYHDNLSRGAMISLVIYSVTVLSLYLASTLLHCFVFTRAKRVFQILDHSNIFFTNCGHLYTLLHYFCKQYLGKYPLGKCMGLAIAGIISHIVFHGKYQKN
ncbi:hemolysin III family protein [Lentilactobacillus kisonensis]|uniref:hemolysin III family protein n=1 Tax=Lentilactobacillus kisonensis TaxID=481722 RepID=UPI001FB50BFA|nr:hemolysin III family protein [Lentilactobacillus kisonensis]